MENMDGNFNNSFEEESYNMEKRGEAQVIARGKEVGEIGMERKEVRKESQTFYLPVQSRVPQPVITKPADSFLSAVMACIV